MRPELNFSKSVYANRRGKPFLFLFCGTMLLASLVYPAICKAGEARGRYATLRYDAPQLLDGFNERLSLGSATLAFLGKRPILTRQDEVLAKIDAVVEQVETALAMFPDQLHLTLVLLGDREAVAEEVAAAPIDRCGDNIACYCPTRKTIFLSAKDADALVLAHEVGHAVIDGYFNFAMPGRIKDVLARAAETHFRS
jgi:hypothetical protein